MGEFKRPQKQEKLSQQQITERRRNLIISRLSSQNRIPSDAPVVGKAKVSRKNSTMEILDNYGKRQTSAQNGFVLKPGDSKLIRKIKMALTGFHHEERCCFEEERKDQFCYAIHPSVSETESSTLMRQLPYWKAMKAAARKEYFNGVQTRKMLGP